MVYLPHVRSSFTKRIIAAQSGRGKKCDTKRDYLPIHISFIVNVVSVISVNVETLIKTFAYLLHFFIYLL